MLINNRISIKVGDILYTLKFINKNIHKGHIECLLKWNLTFYFPLLCTLWIPSTLLFTDSIHGELPHVLKKINEKSYILKYPY